MKKLNIRLLSLALALVMVLSMLPMTAFADSEAGTLAAGFTPVGSTEIKYYCDAVANPETNTYASAEEAFAEALIAWSNKKAGTVSLYTDVTLETLSLFSTDNSVISMRGDDDSLTLNLGDNTIQVDDSFVGDDRKIPYFFTIYGAQCNLTINGGTIRIGSASLPVTRPFLQIGAGTIHDFAGTVSFHGVDICQIGNKPILMNKGNGGTVTLNGGRYFSSHNLIISSDETNYGDANTTTNLTGGVELVTPLEYAVRVGSPSSTVYVDNAVIHTAATNCANGYCDVETKTRPGLTIMAGTSSSGDPDYDYNGLVIVTGSSTSATTTEIDSKTYCTLTIAPDTITPPATAVEAAGLSVIPGSEVLFYANSDENQSNRTYNSVEAAYAAALAAWDIVGHGTVTLYQDVAVSGNVAFPGADNTALISVGAGEDLALTFADGVDVTGGNAHMAYIDSDAQLTVNGGNLTWGGNDVVKISNTTDLSFTGSAAFNNVTATVTGGFDFVDNSGLNGEITFNDGYIKVYNAGGSGSGLVVNLSKEAYESTTTIHLRGMVELWCYQFITMRVGQNAKVYAEEVIAHANARTDKTPKDSTEGCWGVAGYYTSTGGTKYDGNNVVPGSEDGILTTQVLIGDRVQFPELESANTASTTFLATNVTIKYEAFTVTWKDEDDTVLETDEEVLLNTTPEFNGETPTKASDSQYNYFFAGWSPALTAVTKDITYTATYVALSQEYVETTVTLEQERSLTKLYGRPYYTDAGLNMNFASAAFEFTVDCGGTVTMTCTSQEDDIYFWAFVDGQKALRARVNKGESTVTLALGLQPGVHTIRVVRDSDAAKSGQVMAVSAVTFHGKKDTMKATANQDLLIEFIGDSITAGKYTEMQYVDGNAIHSGTNSYAYLTAQKLNADWSVIARGGCGFFHVVSCPKTMRELYPYYNGFMTSPVAYTPARQADVVVLALGTNDAQTDPADTYDENGTLLYSTFEGSVKYLIGQIRDMHGSDVKIVLLHNMMDSDWETELKTVAQEENAFFLSVTQNRTGGNSHPSIDGHKVIANELTAFLQDTVIPTISAEPTITAAMDGHALQFTVDKDDVTSGSSAVITRTYADSRTPVTETIPMASWTDSGTQYCITYTGMDAKGIYDQVSVEIRDADGETVLSWTGSAGDIAATGAESSDEATKNHTLALLGYSAAAQTYFGYNTDAENTYADEIAALKQDKADELTAARKDNSSLSGAKKELVYGTSMVLGAKLTMKVYFTSGDVTVKIDGQEVTLEQSGSTSYYYCKIPVAAKDIFEPVSIQVLQNGTLVAEATDSPASYFARIYDTGEAASQELAESALLYGLMAQST